MRTAVIFIGLALLFFGCSKEEQVTIHENLVVSGNEAPPYDGVTTLQVERYVTKLYIDLLGQEPSASELSTHVATLQNAGLDSASRVGIVQDIFQEEGYYDRLFQLASSKMLEGVGMVELNEIKLTFDYVIQLSYDQGDDLTAQLLELEVAKIEDLIAAPDDYQNGTITANIFYARFINNNVYDDINMGSENYVASCFENLFNRGANEGELSSGVAMVDGAAGILFLQEGHSKQDFVEIMTSEMEFYQGLVQDNYIALLLREPSSTEIFEQANELLEGKTLQEIQTNIVITDEYAGF